MQEEPLTGRPKGAFDRRTVSRTLSEVASASIADILRQGPEPVERARVIGITGAPGAGKSTLIARLAVHRLQYADRLAVIAIDPTSPRSKGSLLGDRIRMESLSADPRVFIRSLPSRTAEDGLTDNLAEVLAALDGFGFDEVLIETVGVGQTGVGVRALAHVDVLVLTPGSGDYVQAMKAGVMETADIYVINKADLPGADRMAGELHSVLGRSRAATPPTVLQVRALDDTGVAELSVALDRKLEGAQTAEAIAALRQARRKYQVQRLVQRRLAEVIDSMPDSAWNTELANLYRSVMDGMHAGLTDAVAGSPEGGSK